MNNVITVKDICTDYALSLITMVKLNPNGWYQVEIDRWKIGGGSYDLKEAVCRAMKLYDTCLAEN